MVNGLHLYSAFIQSAVQFMPLIHLFTDTLTHQRRLAAMQGTNQLVRSNRGLGVSLRDTSTRPGCHLADAFIQSDLQLIRPSGRHTPWNNVGLRALLKGQQLCRSYQGPHQGSNQRPCGSKSSSLTTTLQAAPIHICGYYYDKCESWYGNITQVTCM